MSRKAIRNDLWYAAFALGSTNPVQRLQTRRIVDQVSNTGVEFDVVVSEAPQTSDPARVLARRNGATLVLNKHNSYFDLLDQYLESTSVPRVVRRRAVANLERYEQRAIADADVVVFQSDRDRADFEVPDRVSVAVIPNGTDYEAIRAGGDPGRLAADLGIDDDAFVCLFVGSFDYEPNGAAATVIADELAPRLPDVEFLLVGRNPPPTSARNVHAPGFVEELPDALDLADVGICPLPRGSGTKLKMLDYMAAGLPIVTTTVGVQGLPMTDGEHALVRDDPDAFADAIALLSESPAIRERLSGNARSLARQYSWRTLLERYERLLSDDRLADRTRSI